MSATDGFDLRADGTIFFQFDDVRTSELRRPTLAEYRALAEGLEKMRQDVPASDGPGFLARLQDNLLEWERLVFDTIGSTPLPDEDQLPAWMLNGAIASQLVEHWQKVPSRRGVR